MDLEKGNTIECLQKAADLGHRPSIERLVDYYKSHSAKLEKYLLMLDDC